MCRGDFRLPVAKHTTWECSTDRKIQKQNRSVKQPTLVLVFMLSYILIPIIKMKTDSQTNPEKMAAATTRRTTVTSPRRSPTTTASTATTADVQSWWQNMVRMVRQQPYSLYYGMAILLMLLSFFSLRLLNPAYPVLSPSLAEWSLSQVYVCAR